MAEGVIAFDIEQLRKTGQPAPVCTRIGNPIVGRLIDRKEIRIIQGAAPFDAAEEHAHRAIVFAHFISLTDSSMDLSGGMTTQRMRLPALAQACARNLL